MPREDEATQKLARIDNFNDVTDKATEEKIEMSELESAMKDCNIKMEENLFYKVIKNEDGKILGVITARPEKVKEPSSGEAIASAADHEDLDDEKLTGFTLLPGE